MQVLMKQLMVALERQLGASVNKCLFLTYMFYFMFYSVALFHSRSDCDIMRVLLPLSCRVRPFVIPREQHAEGLCV